MKRDGSQTSLWQHNMPDYIPKVTELPQKVFDALIVGGGVTGVTTALQLQKAGWQCILAEAHTLCFGTTGGTTAHLNTFLDNSYDHIEKDFGEEGAQLIARATNQALELYRSNVEEYNIDCGYEQKDGYLYSQNDRQTEELNKIFEASRRAGVDVAYTDRIPVPIEFQKAIVYHEQANIHPSRYVYALARALEEQGGVILQNCAITDFKGDDVLEVETSLGILHAKTLIWATHIPPGINLLHFRCAPYRSYSIAVTLNDGAYPDGLAYDMYDPYHYYRTQVVDGKSYFIVGGEDHKTAHVENTEECFQRLEAHARKYFDVKEVTFQWSSQYYEPADGLAYIGHLPGNPKNVFVATGYGGNGMTYSHIAAITLTDLITKGDSRYAALFDPGRVKPIAGFTNFVKENADVVKEFVGKRLAREKLPELADLAYGEARLAKYEGKTLALYKDEDGKLHALNPVCPHAKCSVGWNSTEKSWDCPCHGSRFTIDGEILTGPAQQGLEVVAIEDLMHEEKH
jgi:glycine/D-amino acid oxidase-like deaminating enzyme/nitrite reductase/ring-hydroxylating ferredoxin subunit